MRRAVVLLALVACDGDRGPRWTAAGATAPRDGGVLRVASPGAVSSLDPAIQYDEVSTYVLHAVSDGLVGYGAGTELEPRLAQSWTISPDGLVYTFRLREEATYADGTPIVAGDFTRAFERVLTTKDSPYGSHLANVVGGQDVLDGKAEHCKGIAALDPHTLQLTLVAPNVATLAELAMLWASPIPEGYAALPADQARRAPPASGPYELVAWDEGRRVELRRRARYYDRTRQHLDGIVLLENVPRDLQFMMVERGELDAAMPLTASDQRWLEQQPAWAPSLRRVSVLNAFGSRMNTQVGPFADKRVRQALNYAVDKQRIVRLLIDTAVPAHGVLAPGVFGRDDTLQPYPHDPAKARALLREAGYPDGFTATYVTLADEEAEKLAVSLQHDLAEVGVRIDIQTMTLGAFAEAIQKPSGPPFSIMPWAGDFADPTALIDPLFHSRGISDEAATNSSFLRDPALDKLIDDAHVEADPVRRAALYHQIERTLYDDAPWIWGYHQVAIEVSQPYVRDYAPHPVWLRDFTRAWLDLGPDGRPVKK